MEIRTVRTVERDGRAWLADDEAAMFSAWSAGHKTAEVSPNILPRLGVVAVLNGQDSAAGWLYMDNSVGVGFVEWLVTRPGLSLADAKGCMAAVFDALAMCAKDLGYGLLIGHCHPSLHRIATRELGWQDTGGQSRSLFLPLA